MKSIGIYGEDISSLTRYVDFAVRVRSLPVVLLGPKVDVLRRVASSFKNVKYRKFDPRDVNNEIDSIIDTTGKILEVVVRECKNLNYVTAFCSIELERDAEKYASEAKRKKILILIGADLHMTSTDCVLQHAANRLKVKYTKLFSCEDLKLGVHYRIRSGTSLKQCLSVCSSTILSILDGSIRIERMYKKHLPRRIISIVSPSSQGQYIWHTHSTPIIRVAQRDNKVKTAKGTFLISLEKDSPWSIVIIFWLLSSWIFHFLISRFEWLRRVLKQFILGYRSHHQNQIQASSAFVWCHLEKCNQRAMYVLDLTAPSSLDVQSTVRISENLLYRLPRRLAGSGALLLKRTGWKMPSTAFGSDFASRLDSVRVVDDGWRNS